MQVNLINIINLFNLVNSSSDLPLPTSSCVTAPSNAMVSEGDWVCLTGGSNETYGLNNSCVVVDSDNDPSYHCLNESSWCVSEGEGERCYPIDNEFIRHDFSVPEDVCEYINGPWICSLPTANNSYTLIGGNYTCDGTGTVETVEMDNGECSKTPTPSPDDGNPWYIKPLVIIAVLCLFFPAERICGESDDSDDSDESDDDADANLPPCINPNMYYANTSNGIENQENSLRPNDIFYTPINNSPAGFDHVQFRSDVLGFFKDASDASQPDQESLLSLNVSNPWSSSRS
jgi:hypothetical protein